MGLITPVGVGTEESWSAICAGKSGVSEITRFDASEYQTRIAAEVKGFNAEDYIPRKEAKRNELFISYAMAATRIALEDSGLKITMPTASVWLPAADSVGSGSWKIRFSMLPPKGPSG